MIFSAGTAAAGAKLNSSMAPKVLKNVDVQIDKKICMTETQIHNIAFERFNIAESIQAIAEIPATPVAEQAEVIQESQYTPEVTESVTNEAQTQSSTDIPQSTPLYSDSDLYWLSRIIEAEASGESVTGKIAVGNCVLNRVKSSEFPNTIYGVIFDKKYGVQYQPTANGAIYNNPSFESVQAAKDALNGYSVVGDAMYFCSTAVAPTSWAARNRAYLTTIGNHVFYL